MDLQLLFIYAILAGGLALSARFVWRTYVRPASKTGFGRGAPGFQTSVRKEWVKKEDLPADHILRRRVIEEVDLRPNAASRTFAGSDPSASGSSTPKAADEPANEWLPANTSASKRPQSQRKSSRTKR